MRYILLIYTDEQADPQPGQAGFDEMMAGYGAFTREVNEKGVFRAGAPLESVATATSVRVRGGETIVSDGPFAETKEQLGGYYILDCADLDEALRYAAKIPGALRGSIEVRPVREMGG
jgi:hypothetical protein